MKNFFKRIKPVEPAEALQPAEPTGAVEQVEPIKVIGVSEAEWHEIINELTKEYKEAKSRQKGPDAAPSQYMKGLTKALDVMTKVIPHNLMEA